MSNYRRGGDFRSRSRSPAWDGGGRRRDREWDRDQEWDIDKEWDNSVDDDRHNTNNEWGRNREWDSDRDWDADKERDRNRDRDRDGEWERDRWRSRGRRDRSPVKRGRDRYPGGGANRERDAHSSFVPCPSCTLAIKNIASNIDESMVEYSYKFSTIDLMSRTKDGEPRHLAFVEFASVDEARAVLQAFPGSSGQRPGGGRLLISGSATRIEYAMPRNRSHAPMWECSSCHDQNYSHRSVCYRCKTPKPAGQSSSQYTTGDIREPGEIEEMPVLESLNPIVTSRPTSVLLLRGTSVHTSEESIVSALNRFAPVLQVRILRDRVTGTPRGAALVQFSCKEHSEHTMGVLEEKSSGELEVDGAPIKVSYARGESVAALEVEAMNVIDHTPQNLQRIVAATASSSTSPLPAIYGVELGQIAAAAAGKQSDSDVAAKKSMPVVPAPPKEWPLSFQEAGASYVFEASSGYFLEASTGVYYDPKTKLYCKGGKWYFHVPDEDPPYVPVEENEGANLSSAVTAVTTQQQQPESSSPVVPVSTVLPTTSLVPTDMQRSKKTKLSFGIAKSGGNQHGKGMLGGGSGNNSTIPISARKRMADISKWTKTKEESTDAAVPPESSSGVSSAQQPALVAEAAVKEAESILTQSYVSPALPDAVKVPTVKNASKYDHTCTLCQRGFKNADQLAKHVSKSALHAENVRKTGNRDRAAERRAMHKQENRTRSLSEDRELERAANAIPQADDPVTIVESASRETPIAGDNIGAQMLQTMGWREGKGLGRKSEGITAPIEEKATVGTAGVGAQVPMIRVGEHITAANGKQYKAQLRVMAQARYQAAGHDKS